MANMQSIGAITGRVTVMTGRSGNWFAIYEPVHETSVRCNIPANLVGQMDESWRRLVTVEGSITRDGTGRPISIDAERIDFHDEPEPGSWRRAQGVLTSDEPAEITIRRQRDNWFGHDVPVEDDDRMPDEFHARIEDSERRIESGDLGESLSTEGLRELLSGVAIPSRPPVP